MMLTIVDSALLDLLEPVLELVAAVAEEVPDDVRVTPCISFISDSALSSGG